jgi:hypothetical protein
VRRHRRRFELERTARHKIVIMIQSGVAQRLPPHSKFMGKNEQISKSVQLLAGSDWRPA